MSFFSFRFLSFFSFLLLVSLPIQANAPFLSSDDAELKVGLFNLDITPHIGVPLAGYGATERRLRHLDWDNTYADSFFFRPSEGVHTPIRSKVMALRKGDKNLIFVSLDMVGVEGIFIKDLAKRLAPLGVNPEDLIVSATHTHEGPGTLSRTLPLELVAVDFFKRKNYDFTLAKVLQSIQIALYMAEPADLFQTSQLIEGVQKNKFRKKDQHHYNNKASFLLAKAKSDGRMMGGLVNFAVHGGGMPVELLLFSSDFPGQIEIHLEKLIHEKNKALLGEAIAELKKPSMVFFNGAEGDVAVPDRGVELIESLGQSFADQAAPALEPANLKPVAPTFSVKRSKTWLGIPAIPLRYALSKDGTQIKHKEIPLKLPIVGLMHQRAYQSVVRVGDMTMLTWPGEASTQIGYNLQAEAAKLGFNDAWFLGLTNEYMAYFTTKEEYHEGAYDSQSSEFNWRGQVRIINKHKKLLKEIKKAGL